MRTSEIFDEFVKLAEEKGMISDSKKKLEENPRASSSDIKDIEKLYNVKTELPDDMKYKRNIIENAHKEKVVLSPAHDKINGLVENNNERQDIIVNMINRKPTGQYHNAKYAEKEFILSLVRVGNYLDLKDQDKLTKLADKCLEQTTLKKEAAGFLLPIVGAIAATIGALYVQQHSSFYNKGFMRNHEALISELDDFLTANTNYEVGYSYKPEFIKLVGDFKLKLNNFKKAMSEVMSVINNMRKPRTGKELAEMAKEDGDDVKSAYDKLFEVYEEHYSYLSKIKANFSSQSYKEEQIADKGFFSDLADSAKFLHGGKSGLVADDFDDVVRALDTYIDCIANPQTGYLKLLSDSNNIAELAKEQLTSSETAVAKAPQFKDKSTAPPSPQTTTQPSSMQEDEDEFAKVFGE